MTLIWQHIHTKTCKWDVSMLGIHACKKKFLFWTLCNTDWESVIVIALMTLVSDSHLHPHAWGPMGSTLLSVALSPDSDWETLTWPVSTLLGDDPSSDSDWEALAWYDLSPPCSVTILNSDWDPLTCPLLHSAQILSFPRFWLRNPYLTCLHSIQLLSFPRF